MVGSNTAGGLSRDGPNSGTGGWKAPERYSINEDQGLTKAMDIYAYGCLCYMVNLFLNRCLTFS
jgi:serine/threonine protein kinase